MRLYQAFFCALEKKTEPKKLKTEQKNLRFFRKLRLSEAPGHIRTFSQGAKKIGKKTAEKREKYLDLEEKIEKTDILLKKTEIFLKKTQHFFEKNLKTQPEKLMLSEELPTNYHPKSAQKKRLNA